MPSPEPLQMYVIYGPGTSDLPGQYVCRRHESRAGESVATSEHWTGPTLDSVREQLQPGLYCLPRFENDDPNIIEVWM